MSNFTVANYLQSIPLDNGLHYIVDTGANLATLSANQMSYLGIDHVNRIDATDDVLSLTVAQYKALMASGVTLTPGDFVTLADTGANLALLTPTDIGSLIANGIDQLDATDNALSLTVAQYTAFAANNLTLAAGDLVTLSDTAANIAGLTVNQITALSSIGVDKVDATDSALGLTVAKAVAFGSVTFGTTQLVKIVDSGANIGNLTSGQIAALSSAGLDQIDASDNVVSLSAAKALALGDIVIASGDVATVQDTAANIQALTATQIATFATHGFDKISVGGALSLNVAQFNALGSVALTLSDTVTLSDTQANLHAASSSFNTLAGKLVDAVALNEVSVAEFRALGAVTVSGTTPVLKDGATALNGLTNAEVASLATQGVASIDSTDNALTLNVAKYNSLVSGSVALTAADVVTLSDTALNPNLAGANFATWATNGIDKIDSSASLTLDVAKFDALALTTISFTSATAVTVVDTESNLMAVSSFSGYASKGVDTIQSDGHLALSVAQYQSLGAVHLTGADTLIIEDTKAHLLALTAADKAKLIVDGIDGISVTDGPLTLSVAEYRGLVDISTAPVLFNNTATLLDTQAHISSLTSGELQALDTATLNYIEATGGSLSVSAMLAHAIAISTSPIEFESTNTVNLDGDDADFPNVSWQDIVALAQLGLDGIAAVGDLALTVEQLFNAQNINLPLSAGNGAQIVLVDASATITSYLDNRLNLSLTLTGADRVNATDDSLSLSVAQYGALGGAVLTQSDDVTLTGAGADLITFITGSPAGALANAGIDKINASDDALTFTSIADARALGAGVVIDSSDIANLKVDAVDFEALTPAEIAAFAANGFDMVLTGDGNGQNDRGVVLSVEQAMALGSLKIDSFYFANKVHGAVADIAMLSPADYAALIASHVNVISIDTPASNPLTIDAAHAAALVDQYLPGLSFDTGNIVTVADTGAALAALDFAALASAGVTLINPTNDVLDVSVMQVQDLVGSNCTISAADTVTLVDTGVNIGGLSAGDISALTTIGVDTIDANDDALSLTVAQYQALIATACKLADGDYVTLSDTGANLLALTVSDIQAFHANGIDEIHSSDPVSMTVDQYLAFTSVDCMLSGIITIADTADNIAALSDGVNGQFAGLYANGVRHIDANNGNLVLSAAQATAAHQVGLGGGNDVVISDTRANIEALSPALLADFAASAVSGVVVYVEAKEGATLVDVAFNAAQATALGAMIVNANTATLSDTGSAIADLSAQIMSSLGMSGNGFGYIDATNDQLSLTAAQYAALVSASVALTSGDDITLTVDASGIFDLSSSSLLGGLAQAGIDQIDSADSISLNWIDAMAIANGVTNGKGGFVAGNTVTLSGLVADINNLTASDIAMLAPAGFDHIESNVPATFSVAQAQAMGSVTMATGSSFELADTAGVIGALSSAALLSLIAHGMSAVGANDQNVISLLVDQAKALVTANVIFTGNSVSLSDTSTHFKTLTPAQISSLVAAGLNQIDITDGALTLNAAQAAALGSSASLFNSFPDTVNVSDTGAHIAAVDLTNLTTQVGANGGVINVTDDVLNVTAAQYQALKGSLSASDVITIVDSGANIAAMSATGASGFADLATNKIDYIDVSGAGLLSLTVDQYRNLNTVRLTAADTITLSDTGANLSTLTANELSGLSAKGVDAINVNASTSDLTLSVAKLQALTFVPTLVSGAKFVLSDTVFNIASLSATQLSNLAAKGIGWLDANDNTPTTLNLTVAQVLALGSVKFGSTNSVAIFDSAAHVSPLSASQLASLNTAGVDFINISLDSISLSVAQAGALGSIVITSSGVVTLSDLGATIGALTAGDIAGLAAKGFDSIDTTDNVLSLSLAKYQALGNVTLTAADVVTLADTATNLQSLSAADIAALSVDKIDATDNVLSLTVAKYQALGNIALTSADVVTLADTAGAIQALTAADFFALAGKGIDKIDSTGNALSLAVDQYRALGAVQLTQSDTVTLSDTAANLGSLTTSELSGLFAKNVDRIDATDATLTLTATKASALSQIVFGSTHNVEIVDTAANISALSAATLSALAGNGLDRMHASSGTISLTVEKALGNATALIDAGDTVVVADTGANISALTSVQLATFAGKGIDSIDATNDLLNLTVAQYQALGAVALTTGDYVTIKDTGANLSALTVQQLNSLTTNGVDAIAMIDAVNDFLPLTVAKYQAFPAALLQNIAGTVKLADTGSNINALTPSDLGALASRGIDAVDATDNALTLNFAQYQALISTSCGLSSGDVVTLSDTNSVLSERNAAQMAALYGNGVDFISATGGTVTLTASLAAALGDTKFVSGDTAKIVDSGFNIGLLTAAQITKLAAGNLGVIEATDGAVSLTAAQAKVIGSIQFRSADTVVVADTGANIATMTSGEIGALAGANVDRIDATDNLVTLTVGKYQALGAVSLTPGDFVTLEDTAAAISALTSVQFGQLASAGIDKVKLASGQSSLSLTVAQYQALVATSCSVTSGDLVILADTGANLAALVPAQFSALSGNLVDKINATDAALNLTVAQYKAIIATACTLTSSNAVTLVDTGSNIASLSSTELSALASNGVDFINASDNSVSLTAAQSVALGAVVIDAGDTATLVDTGANISALSASQLGGLAAKGIDSIDANDGVVALDKGQYLALIATACTLTASDTVTLRDTGANLASFSFAQFGAFAGNQIDKLDATDNVLAITKAQYLALVSTTCTLTSADVVTLSDTGANIAGLTAGQFGALAANGVDKIDASDNALSLSLAQYQALVATSTMLSSDDVVTLTGTGSDIGNLTASQMGALWPNGVDFIDASDNAVSLTAAQAAALGPDAAHSAKFVSGDMVTVVDTAANISALTPAQIALLAGNGVDRIDSTDNLVNFTAAQVASLGTVYVVSGDTVTVLDTGANIAASSSFAGFAGNGVDKLDASDNALSLTVAKYLALIGTSTTLTAGDTVTLADTGANLATLSSAQFGALTSNGVDKVDATDDVLSISMAKFDALVASACTLAATDVVTLVCTQSEVQNMSSVYIGALAANGVDYISSAGNVTVTLGQVQALGAVKFTDGSGLVTVGLSAADMAGLSAGNIATLVTAGVDYFNVATDYIRLTVAQTQALGGASIVGADEAVLLDTSAALQALTPSQFAGLAVRGIDSINASDNVLSLTTAQYLALGSVQLSPSDVVTDADTGANISNLTAAQMAALAANQVDKIDASDNVLALSVAQYLALIGTSTTLAVADVVTLADSGVAVGSLTAAQFGALAANGVDRIDTTDNVLSLTKAQYFALIATTTTLAAADVVTLADTGANIASLTAAELGGLAGNGVDKIDATDNVLALSTAQYLAVIATACTLTASDAVTIVDTGANVAALTAAQIAALGGNLVDYIDATDNVIDLTAAQARSLGSVVIAALDLVTVRDTGANIAALTAAQLGALAGNGVDKIDASDNTLSLGVAKYLALIPTTCTLAALDQVTLSDTGANIATLTAAQFGALASNQVDKIDASDNALALSVAQYLALVATACTLTPADIVTLADTGANVAALTAAQFGALAANGVNKIDTTDNVLSLTKDQYLALIGTATTLTAADVVTFADTGANIASLTSVQFGALASNGVDKIDATDNALALTTAQYLSLIATACTLTAADVVTIADTGANIASLSAVQFGALAGNLVDKIDASDNVLALTTAQYLALIATACTLTAADVVTLADTGANIAALSAAQVGALAVKGVDKIDSSTDALALTVAQYLALISTACTLTAADVVTIADTGANIATLTAAQLSALASNLVDKIDASDNVLSITVAQYLALIPTACTLTAADVVTLADSSANLAALTAAQFGALGSNGVDKIDASDNVLSLSKDQYLGLVGASVTLTAADVVTLADTGANIASLTAAQFAALAANGVDKIDATDNVLALSTAQYLALIPTACVLTAADVVTIADTGANIATLSAAQFGALASNGVDKVDASDNVLSVSVAQYVALSATACTLTAADVVTLADTGANVAGLSTVQFGALASNGVDKIDASDNVLSLSKGQYVALIGTSTTLTASDVVTFADTGANIASLTAAQFGALATNGVDKIDALDNALGLTTAQYLALVPTACTLTVGDVVTLLDTGANISALSAAQFGVLGSNQVDKIDASDNVLVLTTAQYLSLVGTGCSLTTADVVTIADTAANISALTAVQVGALAANGVDKIDATDNALSLSVSQFQALGAVALTSADVVTLVDSNANVLPIASQLSLLGAKGVDFIDSTDNLVNLTAAQAASLGSVAYVSGDVVSVLDTGANIGGLTAAQLGALSGSGVDLINASDNQLSLSVAQVNALGVLISAGDTVALVDTANNIKAMTSSQFASLADKGIDVIDVSNDVISISAAQASVLGSTYFAAADTVTVFDTPANIAALSSTQLSNFSKNGVDKLDYNGSTNFNGDGFSDIILQNKLDGHVYVWDMNGKSLVASGYLGWTPGAEWVVKGTGDFDFNGYSDVVLQRSTDGAVYLWNKAAGPDAGVVNNNLASQGFVGWTPGADWKVKGTGDFNGDHKSDILLQQDSTGSCYVWEMSGTSLVSNGFLGWSPGKDWVAKGVGDFNGDGYSDVLLQNAIDGSCYIWEVDGSKALNGAGALKDSGFIGWAPGVDWQAKGVGDFNADGKDDVLLQNAKDGSVYIWELDGKNLVDSGFVGWAPGKDWQVKSTGDYNGDGKSDVLLQNVVDGSCYVWELNGTNGLVDHGFVGWAAGAGWQILV